MKFHKTYTITLVLLAVIGTTTTVVYAEGPGGDDQTERPDPTQVLDAEDVAVYNTLPQDVQQIITNEIVPQLLSKVRAGPLSRVTGEAYDAEVKALVEFVVRAEKENQDALARAVESLRPGNAQADTGAAAGCSYTTSIGASSLVVYAAHVSSCDATMAAMNAGAQLLAPSWDSGWIHQVEHNSKRASSYASRSYKVDTCWTAKGNGWATPRNDGPNPSPVAGSGIKRECYE